MPKDRMNVDTERLDDIVAGIARNLEDAVPSRSSAGFANDVFIGSQYVYKRVPRLADGTLEIRKERAVLTFLSAQLPESAKNLVAELVHSEDDLGDLGSVDIYTKLPGATVESMNQCLSEQLGAFLGALHGCAEHDFIHEFEGETSGPAFGEYVNESVDKFVTKLRGVDLEPDLLDLAERAARRAREIVADKPEPALVTLHKDLFGQNLLADGDTLRGVIDWEAAQSGPLEWEFAILRQRFPATWGVIANAYGRPLDIKMLDLCGLVQSLRFWKSFPHQEAFVKQQVDYIRRILEGQ